MAIYDRDYYREPRTAGMGRVRMWSITTWLIVINVAVYVIGAAIVEAKWRELAAQGIDPRFVVRIISPLEKWGAFSIYTALLHGQVWRMISCQFLHAGFWHLAMNMIGLWLFGPMVEAALGARRYAYFYMLCGIAGPVMYTALWGLGILVPSGPEFLIPSLYTELLGASAGIFGVILAAAYLYPNRPLNFFFVELPLKYFAWGMMFIAAYTVLEHGNNAGGQAAHLGGGLLGWFLIRSEGVLNIVSRKRMAGGRKVKDWSRDLNR